MKTCAIKAFLPIFAMAFILGIGAILPGCAETDMGTEAAADMVDEDATVVEEKAFEFVPRENIPRIDIYTENGIALDHPSLISTERKGVFGEIFGYNYTNATISVSDIEDEYVLDDVAAQVKIRGNYTAMNDKKPIRIKFENKQGMLGLNGGSKFKSWVLLAEWKDPSMLQNSVAFYLGSALLGSDGYYVADFCYAHVYLNGQYNGLYLLTEQQQINKNRVDIPEAKSADDGVHTGYFIEYDGYYLNEPELQSFTVKYDPIRHLDLDGEGVLFNPTTAERSTKGFTVKNDIYSQEQHDFIKKCVQTVWNVVYDATYKKHDDLSSRPYHTMDENGNYIEAPHIKTAQEAVASVIDVRSLIDMYILCELAEDFDIGWSSFNFALDMSESGNRLLTYVAPWDFDYALGNSVNDGAYVSATLGHIADLSKLMKEKRMLKSDGSYYFAENASITSSDFTFENTEILYAAITGNPWLVVFTNQDWFWEQVYEKWTEATEDGVFRSALKMIDTCTEMYASDYAMNYARWDNIGVKLDTAQPVFVACFRTQAHASAYLKAWLEARIEGLNTAFAARAAN